MKRFALALLVGLATTGMAIAEQRNQAANDPPVPTAAPAAQSGLSAKERLSDKASDGQRVDDCKVPSNKRTRPRPTACPWDLGS
jgi:hypothetical protein